jgi:hypothetical protein
MRKSTKHTKKQRGGKTRKIQKTDKTNYTNVGNFFSEFSVFFISAHGLLDPRNTFQLPEDTYVFNVANIGTTCGSPAQDRLIYDNLYSGNTLKLLTDPTSLSGLIEPGRDPIYEPKETMASMNFYFENHIEPSGITALIDIGVFNLEHTPGSDIIETRARMREGFKRNKDGIFALYGPVMIERLIREPGSPLHKLVSDFDKAFLNLPYNLMRGKDITKSWSFDTLYTEIIKPNSTPGKKILILTYACRTDVPSRSNATRAETRIPILRAMSYEPAEAAAAKRKLNNEDTIAAILANPEAAVDKYTLKENDKQNYKWMMSTEEGKQLIQTLALDDTIFKRAFVIFSENGIAKDPINTIQKYVGFTEEQKNKYKYMMSTDLGKRLFEREYTERAKERGYSVFDIVSNIHDEYIDSKKRRLSELFAVENDSFITYAEANKQFENSFPHQKTTFSNWKSSTPKSKKAVGKWVYSKVLKQM